MMRVWKQWTDKHRKTGSGRRKPGCEFSYPIRHTPIEHMWDLVGRRLARDPRPAASKDELLQRIQAIWNSIPQADIKNLFDSMPRRIATFITVRGGYTKC
ncbi:transposable element Tcb1 transposase [Trichonephila clavipes]|nr:transposable element Tcb1 transposase [Trichonephila clavipes]